MWHNHLHGANDQLKEQQSRELHIPNIETLGPGEK